MFKVTLIPSLLPLGGLQLDSVIEIDNTVWHRTTDVRPTLTVDETRQAFEFHRHAYTQAVSRAFDDALAKLEQQAAAASTAAEVEKAVDVASAVPAEESELPTPSVSLKAAGVGGMEVGSK